MPAADLDELWRAWDRTRSRADRDAIIIAAQRNVTSSVRNVKVPTWCDREDLESVGQFGVFEAIEKYDPARGANFSTFVNRRVRSHVLEFIRQQDWVPKRIRKEGRELDEAEYAVAARHGRVGTDAEVAAELGVDEEGLLALRRRQLGAHIYSYSDSGYGDFEDVAAPGPDTNGMFEVDEVRKRIAQALTSVTDDRHRIVLALHFVEGLTGPEIAKVMGISKGQVSKLRDQAVLRLRDGLERQRQ